MQNILKKENISILFVYISFILLGIITSIEIVNNNIFSSSNQIFIDNNIPDIIPAQFRMELWPIHLGSSIFLSIFSLVFLFLNRTNFINKIPSFVLLFTGVYLFFSFSPLILTIHIYSAVLFLIFYFISLRYFKNKLSLTFLFFITVMTFFYYLDSYLFSNDILLSRLLSLSSLYSNGEVIIPIHMVGASKSLSLSLNSMLWMALNISLLTLIISFILYLKNNNNGIYKNN